MVREIAAQKLCDERLADRLCASERRHDAQKLQLVGLREALTQAEKESEAAPRRRPTRRRRAGGAEAGARRRGARGSALAAARYGGGGARGGERRGGGGRAAEAEGRLPRPLSFSRMEGWQASPVRRERRFAAAQDGIASDLRVALEARSRIVAERAADARPASHTAAGPRRSGRCPRRSRERRDGACRPPRHGGGRAGGGGARRPARSDGRDRRRERAAARDGGGAARAVGGGRGRA